jgi:hypothetical protein
MLPARSTIVLTGIGAVAALTLTACGGSSGTKASDAAATDNATASTGAPAAAGDNAVLEKVYKGTLQDPDATSRPAVKGKKIVIISAGQASISSSVPVNAAQ